MDRRNGSPEGIGLVRVKPHDAELEQTRRRVEGNRQGRKPEGGSCREGKRGCSPKEGSRTGSSRKEGRHIEMGYVGDAYQERFHGNRRYRRKWTRWQRLMAMVSTFVCTVLLGLGGIHFVKADGFSHLFLPAGTEKTGGESRPQEILGPPVPVASNDVLQREDAGDGAYLVIIDPGHGGTDTGCSREGVMESEINMQIANRLSGKLKSLGYSTVLLRTDDTTDVSLEERVAKAESEKGDIYVSIHQNAYDEDVDDIKGIETWYYGGSEGSRRLAELVHQGAVGKTGAVDRSIQDTKELYVLKNSSMPACLIETSFLSSRSDRGNIVTGEYQDQMAEGIAQGIHSYFNPKTMYLTFDDGPSQDNTTAVLNILKERNIKATFFVVGENVRKHPEVAKRIVEEGHTIGIHCNVHDYRKIYESVDSYLEDFQKAYDAVYEVTGVEAKLFRFPGGSVNAYNKEVGQDIIKAMTEKGYIYFDWNASLEDAVNKSSPEELIQNALGSTLGRKKVVMLAHDVVYNTNQCLERLIDSFPEYEMKPLTAEVEPVHF